MKYSVLSVMLLKYENYSLVKLRGAIMSLSYNKLWKLLVDHQMKKIELAKATKMSPNTMAKLGKNETVSLEILMRICKVLHCDIGDIMEVIIDDNN